MRQPYFGRALLRAATAGAFLIAGCNGGGSSDEVPTAAEPEESTGVAPKSAAPGRTGHDARVAQHEVTFYGWPDNSPPGPRIQSPQIHAQAGGVGTYDDPVTFASAPDAYPPGTILYVPYLKKYAIMEDRCSACVGDWNRGERHIDIWMESDGSNGSALLDCQRYWTRSAAEVELNPPSDRPVDPTPLFDVSTGSCRS